MRHDSESMDIDSYLERIGFRGPAEASTEALSELHCAHMSSVPFENLDIHLGKPIELDFERLYEKVVGRNRGGFCYELNGLFGWLLTALGFKVQMLSARVYGSDGELGPDFDHMLLRVEKDLIADVGFGDSFTEPMCFDSTEQKQQTGAYRFTEFGGTFQLERNRGEGWSPQYLFTTKPRGFDEFENMCRFQQTSTESVFTRKIVCSKFVPEGRVTYANGRFIETKQGIKSEYDVRSAAELRKLFLTRFGFELDEGYKRLLHKSESATQ